MLLAFFSFWPDFGAGLIAIARGCAPVRLICSCKLRLRRASPTVGLPSGDRALLGLRRLHAGGAKTGSYKGHVAGLFFSSAAGRQKRRTGWGRLHERLDSASGVKETCG